MYGWSGAFVRIFLFIDIIRLAQPFLIISVSGKFELIFWNNFRNPFWGTIVIVFLWKESKTRKPIVDGVLWMDFAAAFFNEAKRSPGPNHKTCFSFALTIQWCYPKYWKSLCHFDPYLPMSINNQFYRVKIRFFSKFCSNGTMIFNI